MAITYKINCPKDIDDVRMYNWTMEVRFTDGHIEVYNNYCDVYEMLNWCHRQMENKDISRISIWQDLLWWGEMERL